VTPEEEAAAARRFRHKRRWRCPACLQYWFAVQGLKRHMAILHHRCRFCPKAYILVDQHEKRSHTNEYAIAAGACKGKGVTS
jgi:hypothetical protein